jgi:hypothetical protein
VSLLLLLRGASTGQTYTLPIATYTGGDAYPPDSAYPPDDQYSTGTGELALALDFNLGARVVSRTVAFVARGGIVVTARRAHLRAVGVGGTSFISARSGLGADILQRSGALSAVARVSVGQSRRQVARPVATSVQGTWTNQSGGNDLVDPIDEPVPNDADYIHSSTVFPSSCRIKLAPIEAPAQGQRKITMHAGAETGAATVTVTLRQGGGDIFGAGVLLQHFVHEDLTTVQLLEDEVTADITDYADLYVELQTTLGGWVLADALHVRTRNELDDWGNWLDENSVGGFVGEMGWPADQYALGDSVKWNALGEGYYRELTRRSIWSVQWGAAVAFDPDPEQGIPAYELAPYTGQGLDAAFQPTPFDTAQPQAGPLEFHANDAGVRRGVAITGLEMGADAGGFSNVQSGVHGTNYFSNPAASFTFVSARGVDTVKIAFRWERLQPTLGGPLDPAYSALLTTQISRAAAAGMGVILDCHNSADYYVAPGNGNPGARMVLGGTLTAAHMLDLWTRVSALYRTNPAVIAYGLMNEPHDLSAPYTPGGTLFDFSAQQTPVGTAPTRFFEDTSLWNRPTSAARHPNSTNMIAWLRGKVTKVTISWDQFAVPLYLATNATPTKTVTTTDTGTFIGVPWPTGLANSGETGSAPDNHASILNTDTGKLWDFWQLDVPTAHASVGATDFESGPNGDGFHTTLAEGSARGSSFDLIAGVMQPKDFTDGAIPHALVCSIPAPASSGPVPPSIRTDGKDPSPNAIPEGARLRLPASFDISGYTGHARVIAQCLQKYGCYVGDDSGGSNGNFELEAFDTTASSTAYGFGQAYPWGTTSFPQLPLSLMQNLEVVDWNLTEPLAATPASGDFTDSFTTASVDTARWTTTGTVSQSAGQLHIAATTAGSTLVDRATVDFTGAYVDAKVAQVPLKLTGTTVGFTLDLYDVGSNNSLRMAVNAAGTLRLIVRNGTALDEPSNIPYDPVAHAYWRIAQQGTNVLFQTSPDGIRYTTRRSVSNPTWAMTALTPQMYALYDGVGAQPRDAIVDQITYAKYVSGWTLFPVRSTAHFADGAASWVSPAAGSQYQTTGGNVGNLAQYGDTLSMTFWADVDTNIDLKLGLSSGQLDQNTYTLVPATTPTTITWTPPAGSLTNVGYVGFYVVNGAEVHLDAVEVGTGKSPAKVWEDGSAQLVAGLRAIGDQKLMMVSGYEWSGVTTWRKNHPVGWVPDPNIRYEGHHYFDTESSSDHQPNSSVYEQTYASAVADSHGIAAFQRAAALRGVSAVAVSARRVLVRRVALQGTTDLEVGLTSGANVLKRSAALTAQARITSSWQLAGPGHVAGAPAHNQVVLTWDAIANVVRYEVVRDGSQIGQVT